MLSAVGSPLAPLFLPHGMVVVLVVVGWFVVFLCVFCGVFCHTASVGQKEKPTQTGLSTVSW